jgi:PEP-CTERM motif
MFTRTALVAAAALAAAIATPASAVTNLITNGGFEAGTTFIGWTGTSTGYNGFTTSSINSNLAFVHSGSKSATLRTVTPNVNTIAQNIVTIIGRPYELKYWLMSRDNNGRVIDAMTVTSGPVVTAFGDRPSFAYTQFTQYFVATTTSTLISFAYKHTSPNFYLDDVSVGLVPEPATWGLMVAGFGMVGFAMRRRIRRVAA